MRTQRSKGFTLIELMIVVAIIGILASIAVPAYQDYIARAQAAEAVQLMSGAKTPLSEYYADNGVWPDDPARMGLVTGGRYVLAAAAFTSGAGSGAFTLELESVFRTSDISKFIQGKKVLLATYDGGRSWICRPATGTDGIAPKYLPAGCR